MMAQATGHRFSLHEEPVPYHQLLFIQVEMNMGGYGFSGSYYQTINTE
jgi:hypothetical protein